MKMSNPVSSRNASKNCVKKACHSARSRCCFAPASFVRPGDRIRQTGNSFRKFGGIKFAESAHIKDALAFLRVVVNLQTRFRGFARSRSIDHIGDATVYQILDHLGVERKGVPVGARTKDSLFKKLHRFPARASYKTQLIRLARVLTTVLESKSPGEQLTAVLRFYRPLLKARYDDSQRRGRDLEHLQAIAKRYKTSAKLLDDVALDPSGCDRGKQPEAWRRLCYFVDWCIQRKASSGTACL